MRHVARSLFVWVDFRRYVARCKSMDAPSHGSRQVDVWVESLCNGPRRLRAIKPHDQTIPHDVTATGTGLIYKQHVAVRCATLLKMIIGSLDALDRHRVRAYLRAALQTYLSL